MCGLFGYKFQNPDPRIAAMTAVLAVLMDDRGGDSYGFYRDGEIVKGIGKFCETEDAHSFGNSLYVLAHCRFKTMGSICPENSHPFEAGHIIGAHNGMIYNHAELNHRYDRNCEVDSQHIFEHLNAGLPLDDLHGYGAITYIDTREDTTVHAGRFNSGQLEVAEVYSGEGDERKVIGVVWASTETALIGALTVAGFKDYVAFDIVEQGHYVLRAEGVGRRKEDFDFGKRPVVYSGSGMNYHTSSSTWDESKWEEWRNDKRMVYYNHTKGERGHYEGDVWVKEATMTDSTKSGDVKVDSGLCIACESDEGVIYVERFGVPVCETCLNSWRGVEVGWDDSETEETGAQEDATLAIGPGAYRGSNTILGSVGDNIMDAAVERLESERLPF
jgi:hypothetical protein